MQLPRSRALRLWAFTALLLTLGYAVPSDGLRTGVGIVALFAVLPLSLVLAMDRVRAVNRRDPGADRPEHRVLVLPARLLVAALGLVGVAFGAAVAAWIVYLTIYHPPESITPLHLFGGFGIAPGLFGIGVHFLRVAFGSGDPY